MLRFRWDPQATGEFEWFGFRMSDARELERRWEDDGLISDDGWSFLAVRLEDGTCAGWVGWHPGGAPGTFEIGATLLPEHRGQGIGSEVQRILADYLFNTTTVFRLTAGTEVDNVAEQRALERVGFSREGVERAHHFRAGLWRDSVRYGLLRTDRRQPAGEPQAP